MKTEEALAAIHLAHDLLHAGDIAGAHKALHCGVNDQALPEGSADLAPADAAGMIAFSLAFSRICREHRVLGAFVALVPAGDVSSLQCGGAVTVVDIIHKAMGKK